MPGGPILATPQWPPYTGLQIRKLWQSNQVTPHSTTEQWRYTVPTRRALLITSATILIMRDQIGGVVGRALAIIQLGSGEVVAYAALFSGIAGEQAGSTVGQGAILTAGQVVIASTSDSNSVDGTHEFLVALTGVEYTPAASS